MARDVLEVTSDHAIPVIPGDGSVLLTVVSGSTLYYNDDAQVSSTRNHGSVTAGGTVTFTSLAWVRSAGLSSVYVDHNPAFSAALPVIRPSGDTSGATDTANIQTQLNQLGISYPNQGGQVTLGNGVFYLNAPLTVTNDNVTLAGQGLGNSVGNKNTNTNPQYGGTVLQAVSGFSGSYVVAFGQGGSPTRTLSGCFMKNLSIDCQNVAGTLNGVFWQVFKGGGEHVYVSKPTGSGFVLDGNGSFSFPNGAWDNHFWDWTADTAGANGFTLQNSATDNNFAECTSKFNTGDGWNIDATSTANRWTGGYVYNCTGKGVNAANYFQLKFLGIRFEDCNGGIYLASANTLGGFLITGCTFRNMSFATDNTTDAINLSASATTSGGMIGANDFSVDQGSGNGTGPSWNRPRYLVNLSGGNVKGVTVAPFTMTSTRGDGTFYGTSAVNDLGTSTVLAWCVGGSGLPELKHSGNIRWLFRNGSPAGVVSANIGSICINTAGGAATTLFVKESASDSTGWVGK